MFPWLAIKVSSGYRRACTGMEPSRERPSEFMIGLRLVGVGRVNILVVLQSGSGCSTLTHLTTKPSNGCSAQLWYPFVDSFPLARTQIESVRPRCLSQESRALASIPYCDACSRILVKPLLTILGQFRFRFCTCKVKSGSLSEINGLFTLSKPQVNFTVSYECHGANNELHSILRIETSTHSTIHFE